MSRILQTQTGPDWPWAFAFAILAAAAGIAAGGNPLPLISLSAVATGLYLLAEGQGWLLRAGETHPVGDSLVASVFALLVVGFVALTGGAHSPLLCALYLPILMAALCYGMRLGLLTSLGMAAACALFVLQLSPLPHAPGNAVAIALSFPLVAIFGGVLRAQMEARLRALHTEKDDLSALLDMSQMMESAFDLDMTLNLILLNLQEHSGCSVCAVYLKGTDGRTLELRAASGPRDRVTLLPLLTMEEARTGDWSLSAPLHGDNVRAFYAPDALQGSIASPSRLFEIDHSALSFACVPLDGVAGVMGMLYVGYAQAHGLTPEAVTRLEHLTTRAAFPLQRVLLQQEFHSLAYRDPMTGLDNFQQFEENLADELARAERYNRPLSLILLDIDHFKSFNDTLGHQAGDALLGQLGVVLRNSLRNVDKPARYGGEEFVIICPETGSEEARLIAERIRRNVADTAFALLDKNGEDSRREASHVTASLGCATFPGDARSSRDLIKSADIALYAAKESGRNAVQMYGEVYSGGGRRVQAA